jgi:hypothetical protein
VRFELPCWEIWGWHCGEVCRLIEGAMIVTTRVERFEYEQLLVCSCDKSFLAMW